MIIISASIGGLLGTGEPSEDFLNRLHVRAALIMPCVCEAVFVPICMLRRLSVLCVASLTYFPGLCV